MFYFPQINKPRRKTVETKKKPLVERAFTHDKIKEEKLKHLEKAISATALDNVLIGRSMTPNANLQQEK